MIARKLFKTSTDLSVVAVVAMLVLAAGIAEAQDEEKWGWGYEIRLDLVNSNRLVTGIQPDSGWALTIDMQAKNRKLQGIGVELFPPQYPRLEKTGYLVFEDPDSCPSMISFIGQELAFISYYCNGQPPADYPDCIPPDWGPILDVAGVDVCEGDLIPADLVNTLLWEKDETWLEYTPGLSYKWPVAEGGVVPVEYTEEERPLLWKWGNGWELAPYGPYLGTNGDDVSYGSWTRMPGLVVVADHGPGVIFNGPAEGDVAPGPDYFDLPEPLQAWNLAAFFNSAAYSLKGGTTETSVQAHLNVPYALFDPVILYDNNISIPTYDEAGVLCGEDDALYRLDGGPLTCWVDGGASNFDPIAYDTVTTVRVFVVDGVAPDILEDVSGNGRIDSYDAELMGYRVLSNQGTTRFRQWAEIFCNFPYDFDGDGFGGTCVAPGRPGGIVRPPR